MRIERYGRESAHASRDRTKQGRDYDLANLGLLKAFEYQTFGLDVQGLDHHHHDNDQPCNQYRIS
jgi:hypothetical protein